MAQKPDAGLTDLRNNAFIFYVLVRSWRRIHMFE